MTIFNCPKCGFEADLVSIRSKPGQSHHQCTNSECDVDYFITYEYIKQGPEEE